MNIKKKIRSIISKHDRRIRLNRDAKMLGSMEWAEWLNGWFDDVSQFHANEDGSVGLLKLGVTVSGQTARWLLARNSNYSYCVDLLEKGVAFSYEQQQLVALWQGARFLLEPDTLFILWELIVEDSYRWVLPEAPVLIFDVGMNVGFAALTFAARHPNSLVVGFEPFEATFKRMQRNIALNPHLADRIISLNYGLSDHDGEESWNLNEDNAGVAGQFASELDGRQKTVSVQLKRSSKILSDFLNEHSDRRCFVKMDCEGGEYAIFRDWIQTGFFSRLDLLVMEYHELGGHRVEEIEALLRRGGLVAKISPARQNGQSLPFGAIVAAPLRR